MNITIGVKNNNIAINYGNNMKKVYHGSTIQGLKIIKRRKSTHLKEWVYGSYQEAIATIFISSKGSDLYYHLSGDGTKDNPIILVERKKGMFKDIFNVSGSLYTLNSKNFITGATGWSAEVVSESDEKVINEEYIDNLYDKLIELDKNKKLVLYLYPNRPDNIPLDNSDLIPKVIKWKRKGINIDEFFRLYPELKDKFLDEEKNS